MNEGIEDGLRRKLAGHLLPDRRIADTDDRAMLGRFESRLGTNGDAEELTRPKCVVGFVKCDDSIAPTQIISFSNFAFLPNRLDHLFSGRMPRPMLCGYTWYSTGHIHQLSLLDFYDLCAEIGLEVEAKVWTLNRNPLVRLLCRLRPNLLSALPILKLRRD